MKRPLFFIFIFITLVIPYPTLATPLEKAIQNVRNDIEKAVNELNGLRTKISNERLPLVRNIRKLESQLATLRKEADSLRVLGWQKELAFETLRQEVSSLHSEVDFTSSILLEYRRETEVRAGPAEAQLLSQELQELDKILTSGQAPEDSLKSINPLLQFASNRTLRNLGGYIFSGTCLDTKGLRHNGTFILIGSITYFIADGSSLCGLVLSRMGSTEPSVITIGGVKTSQMELLTSGKEATVPMDITQGDVLKIRTSQETWFEHIKSGGIVIIPILGIGLLCLVLIIWKFISLHTLRTEARQELNRILKFLRDGKIDEAQEVANSLGEPLAPVILEGIEHASAPREHIEEIVHERILSQLPKLDRHLATLAVCAAAAPLLGLLGTVTGMIHTFKLITIFGTGDPKLLSGGISEALVTTEFGLMIAIPVLLSHAYLSRRARKIINAMEQTAIGFINSLKLRKSTK